jgi:acyl-coenzyme A thioesterase PaaI-like protein
MTVGQLREFLADAFPWLGQAYEVHEVTDQGVTMRLELGAAHERPGGTVSGPVMMGMVDAAAWLSTLSRIGPVALAVTSSLTINFLAKPPLTGELLAHGHLLRLGRRTSYIDVRIVSYPGDGTQTLVAQSSVIYSIPSG